LYVFVLSGNLIVENQLLETRDAMGITNFETINIMAQTQASFLLMEIPM
jgi:hypothetical protein